MDAIAALGHFDNGTGTSADEVRSGRMLTGEFWLKPGQRSVKSTYHIFVFIFAVLYFFLYLKRH